MTMAGDQTMVSPLATIPFSTILGDGEIEAGPLIMAGDGIMVGTMAGDGTTAGTMVGTTAGETIAVGMAAGEVTIPTGPVIMMDTTTVVEIII